MTGSSPAADPSSAVNGTSAELLERGFRVPDHVVYRPFATETVVMNLNTGLYHGLNPTAGRMLEALDGAESLKAAAAVVAAELDHPVEDVERDMCPLCSGLLERGLVEPA